jgi:hypothetical protein
MFLQQTLNQHLPGRGDVFMNLLFRSRVNHLERVPTVGARQVRGGAEQATDQRALVVHRAAIRPQVNTVQLVQGRLLLGSRLARQTRHFLGRGGYRPTAIVATWHTFKGRDLLPQKADFLAIAAHLNHYRDTQREGILPEKPLIRQHLAAVRLLTVQTGDYSPGISWT